MSNFSSYSKYYDLLYQDKSYGKECFYIHDLIQRYRPESRDVLELGSGSGSHAAHLCQLGYAVTGVERSETMVGSALAKKIKGFRPLIGDVTTYRGERNSFDCAISMFHVVSYLTSNSELIETFKLTNYHLRPAGLFIFDFWYSPAVLTQQASIRVKRMEDDEVKVIRIAEPQPQINSNIVDVCFEVNVLDKATGKLEQIYERHPMRHFSIPELQLLAELTGFKVELCEEFLTKKAPGVNTWGVCLILRKTT